METANKFMTPSQEQMVKVVIAGLQLEIESIKDSKKPMDDFSKGFIKGKEDTIKQLKQIVGQK